MLSPTDEIKAKLDIVDVVGEYVALKQLGDNWKARCPFHNEKTPSFMVSRQKQIWHCFGCHEGGDVLSFVQKIEGLDFPDTLRLLAKKAGIVLPSHNPQANTQRSRILDVLKTVTELYHQSLRKSPTAQKARDYVASRGLDDLTVDAWQLGFAPDSWEIVSQTLKAKGFNDQELFLAGLTIKKDKGSGYYDRFRDRLMIPIRDHNGYVVGFSARTLDPEAKEAKYINTSQTLVFNKSQILFGLDVARQNIRQQKQAIIVEGNLDVISAHQFGANNVVATCGTALTAEHVLLIKRYTNNVVLCFDPDSAGQIAAERGAAVALSAGLNVSVMVLPDGLDPDAFIRQKGLESWQTSVKQAQAVMQYHFDQVLKNLNVTDPQAKKQAAANLLGKISTLVDGVEQSHWLNVLSDKLNVPENVLREELAKQKKSPRPSTAPTTTTSVVVKTPVVDLASQHLMSLLVRYPSNLPYVIEHITPEMLPDTGLRDLYIEIVLWYNQAAQNLTDINQEFEIFVDSQPAARLQALTTLRLLADQLYEKLTDEQSRSELRDLVSRRKRQHLNQVLGQLAEQIKQAEAGHAREEVEHLSQQFSQLTDQLARLS